ncbi:hypothetical protein vBCbaSRXM_93 [Citromicrobium phage vB_CbaS-RXM]|nr:hypothetical protein vBCbaSRXM_93 [Citromicrobium phage vB_CbaS-RXM]
MPCGLSPHQCNDIERTGVIPEECKFLNPSLHFCPDWDGMLIDAADPEYEYCYCDKDAHVSE